MFLAGSLRARYSDRRFFFFNAVLRKSIENAGPIVTSLVVVADSQTETADHLQFLHQEDPGNRAGIATQ
jgi:hypothetical protein